LFSVKELAVGENVAGYFSSAVAVIADSNTATSAAVIKRAGSSVERQTSVTGKLQTGGLIRKTVKENTGNGGGGPHFPLWIRVPLIPPSLSRSSRRPFYRRLPPKMAAKTHTQPG